MDVIIKSTVLYFCSIINFDHYKRKQVDNIKTTSILEVPTSIHRVEDSTTKSTVVIFMSVRTSNLM
jgi:hypothetical protein